MPKDPKELEFAVTTESSQPSESVVFCDNHRLLARETAGRSMVLLQNNQTNGKALLPLQPSNISKVAVIGRLANVANTGDRGSSNVFSPHVVTPFEGIKAAFPDAEVFLEDTGSMERAKTLAAQADVVICIVGYDATDEGEYMAPSLQNDSGLLDLFPQATTTAEKEVLAIMRGRRTDHTEGTGLKVGAGGDRTSLRLRSQDVEMIEAATSSNSNTVVAIVAAGAIIMEDWKDKVPALLMSWYAGSEGGHALADVLLGRIDASGRLPFSIPKDEKHLPFFDPEATKIKYDRWHGQSLLDKLGVKAAFPVGFGLSYTTFSITDLRIDSMNSGSNGTESFLIRAKIANTGERGGRLVAQVYGLVKLDDFPSRVLLGFAVVDLEPAQAEILTISASSRPLQRWRNGNFSLPEKDVAIEVARFAGDPQAIRTNVVLAHAAQWNSRNLKGQVKAPSQSKI